MKSSFLESDRKSFKIANRLIGLKEVLGAEPKIIVQEMHYKPCNRLYIQQWYLNHYGGVTKRLFAVIWLQKGECIS